VQTFERIRTALERSWTPVPLWQVVLTVVFALAAVFFGLTGQRWFPLLDSANLAFHEAGHPIVGLLSNRLMVYGGTLMQLAIPIVAVISFWRRAEAFGAAMAGIWVFQNFFNIARYMADARRQMLPLLGGGEHDWTEILGRWGLLEVDRTLAGLISIAGLIGVVFCAGWALLCWYREH
jgi:hypothetical protein